MTRLNVIVIIFFLCGQLVNAQEYYLNGDRVNFEFILTSTNPSLGTKYCNGQPCEGELSRKDSVGNILWIAQVKNGKSNGFYKHFFPDGSISEIGQQKNNFWIGLRIQYYQSGEVESVEYFPEEELGILEGAEKISFYENGNIESNYAYDSGWIPKFYYEFSETGDTLVKEEPLPNDSNLFEITEFKEDGTTLKKQYRFNDEGEREFLTETK